MQVSVHLNFNGDCRQAMETYCELMNGEIVSMTTFGDAPAGEEVPDDWQDKIVHATMSLGGVVVATADIPPERYQPPQGFYMFVELEIQTRLVEHSMRLQEAVRSKCLSGRRSGPSDSGWTSIASGYPGK